jgi:hypothetical protein
VKQAKGNNGNYDEELVHPTYSHKNDPSAVTNHKNDPSAVTNKAVIAPNKSSMFHPHFTLNRKRQTDI